MTVPANGPDNRTMAMALGGRPDDSAKIVCSRGCIAYLSPSPLKRQRNYRSSEDFMQPGAKITNGTANIAALAQHLCCSSPLD
jgi:hypothetical protein